jgi:nicotinamide riboside kinase
MNKIAFTGPESSGKSTLSFWLAQQLGFTYCEEFARTHLEKTNGIYTYEDLEVIAKNQVELWEESSKSKPKGIVADTEMIVMHVWSEFKFGKVSQYIVEQIKLQQFDLVFLCKPDIPWEFDPLREHPNHRDELFFIYQETLQSFEIPYITLEGSLEYRQVELLKFFKNRSV